MASAICSPDAGWTPFTSLAFAAAMSSDRSSDRLIESLTETTRSTPVNGATATSDFVDSMYLWLLIISYTCAFTGTNVLGDLHDSLLSRNSGT